ncbi:hypothetical protein FLK61_27240 [Paenalkalicoccus suaedae]|uniref:Uncharacterized protein n=1 Tax=Paenalkalicoccus suaedae TaxID=2592382 RepID=A0A859FCF0_9BACI|nr:hypothetical protein [Paenalkalicoccus suaedae]QKS70451.1 hypothetical protein FLK61_27240 [Paenalkalicoccus suaedae]
MMSSTKQRLALIMMLSMTVICLFFVGLNESSIQDATELCREAGGTPLVSRELFVVNWSFRCDGA